MPAQHHRQQVYDHRLRQLVRYSSDIRIATDLGVPRSTADGWLRGEPATVVTLDLLEMNEFDLQVEVVKLRRRIHRSEAWTSIKNRDKARARDLWTDDWADQRVTTVHHTVGVEYSYTLAHLRLEFAQRSTSAEKVTNKSE